MRRRSGANQRMVYGPFPVKLGSLVAGMGCILVALALLFWALEVTRIHCVRAGSVTCTVQRFRLVGPSRPFQLARVDSTRTIRVNKGRESVVGTLVLQDTDGHTHPSMEVRYAEVVRQQGSLRAFLSEPDPAVFEADMRQPRAASIALSFFGLLMLAIGWAFVRDALRGTFRANLTLVDGRRLQVTRTFWGIPLQTRNIELSGVTAVELDWRFVRPSLLRRSSLDPELGGYLLIHTDRGPLPVLDEVAPGHNVHRRAAIRLRELLGLRRGYTPPPPAIPAGHAWHRGFRRVAACGIGLTTGSLVGIAVGAVLALTVGGAKGSDPAGGAFYFGGLALGALGGAAFAFYLTSETRLQR